MVPVLKEHAYLTRNLEQMGYQRVTQSGWQRQGEIFQFDLFPGTNIHTTGLLASPLEEGRHYLLREYSHLYLGILNYYDLICSKLMRGTRVDFDDCLTARRSEDLGDRCRCVGGAFSGDDPVRHLGGKAQAAHRTFRGTAERKGASWITGN